MQRQFRTLRRAALSVSLAVLSLGRLLGQGGPPMITDDPGTPGDRHWEINLGWTTERTPGSTLYGLPLLDANYGVGDRIELTYDGVWAAVQDDAGTREGAGDSLFGIKWRFHDGGDGGWQASVYPQVAFLDPGSHSDERGLADSATSVLLPFEVQRDFSSFSMNFDFGHLFSTNPDEAGWMGGIVFGRQVTRTWEVDIETHVNASAGLGREEWIVNAGTRIGLSKRLTLMIALGRDVSNDFTPPASLLSYFGLQIEL